MAPAVVVLLADLFFAPRFADVIRASGGEPLLVESPEEFVAAVDRSFPVLTFVDLGATGDWEDAIRRIKLRPHTRLAPVYAFGSHVDAETLKRARKAGADHAWARSRLFEELPDVVARHVAPPVVFPDGWDAALSESARRGLEEFNKGEYFEQHEFLEHAWMEEPRAVREMYQGILQIGVGLLQIERANWAGAIKMFRRGLPRLRALPEVCQGVHVGDFRRAAEAIHAEITALGPQGITTFDRTRFPRITLTGSAAPPPATTQETRTMYGLFGKIRAHPGQRDTLISILLESASRMPQVEGCYLYIVGSAPDDTEGIWVTEVWRSQADHQASLKLEAVQAAIASARPLIAGMGERFEFVPLGGMGLPPGAA